MSSISSCSRAALVACLIVACARVGIAVERMALPAFTLMRGDATSVASQSLVQTGGWVIVYVAPQCKPCQAILRSIDETGNPSLVRRVVVVVAGATAESLRGESARYPNLAGATWLGDAANAIPQAIAGAAAPTILGLRGQMIEWSLAGVLMDATDLKSVLAKWTS